MPAKRNRQSKSKTPRSLQQVTTAASDSESSKPSTGLDNEGFVVDLFLDEGKAVRLTQVLHVKSNDGEAWEGWDERRLIEFFIDRAQLSIPAPEKEAEVFSDEAKDLESSHEIATEQIELAVAKRAATVESEASPLEEKREPIQQRIEHRVEIISSHTNSVGHVIGRGEPLQLRLLLGDATAVVGGEAELNYTVSISAHKRGEGAKYFIALNRGQIKTIDKAIQLSIPMQNLEPGTYRLGAEISIETLPQPEEDILPQLVASLNLQSKLLQVL